MDLGKFSDMMPNQVSRYLDGLDFPAEREEVAGQAGSNQAEERIVAALKKIPPGVCNSTNDVARELGAA